MRGGSGRCGVKREIAGRDGQLEARWGFRRNYELQIMNYELGKRLSVVIGGKRNETTDFADGLARLSAATKGECKRTPPPRTTKDSDAVQNHPARAHGTPVSPRRAKGPFSRRGRFTHWTLLLVASLWVKAAGANRYAFPVDGLPD
jgi:hypothetical protein